MMVEKQMLPSRRPEGATTTIETEKVNRHLLEISGFKKLTGATGLLKELELRGILTDKTSGKRGLDIRRGKDDKYVCRVALLSPPDKSFEDLIQIVKEINEDVECEKFEE